MEPSNSTQLVNIDPKTLLVDTNIRKDVRLDKDFVASIKELGVLVPITAVRTASGDIRVRFGHRRTLAAIEAGRDAVPVDVIGTEGQDDAVQVERIITQRTSTEPD
jgi:ParB family chromosome partitioning protein